ncbi:NAD(P)-dependent oxidoreductase [Halotalea alkalilenta]|uniref:Oxidoreductase n=1 Tax=Halotalea alkalilenta TaxID=376489 RepID=A0A172YIB2_9GAMM|nr:NAD(P)-dependent oxidoreductase [Halotalea alkalilenta]ANF58967.1 oxidoreductase [Halotalea alkalilenta]
MKIAFLGLGRMGRAIAKVLLEAGFELTLWNRSPASLEALVDAGGKLAKSPAEAVKRADVVVSMLADDRALREVMLEGGALEAMRRDAIHVNMATVSVPFAATLAKLHAKLGQGYVAAPVLGRPEVAERGELNLLVAGPPVQVEAVWPLLKAASVRIWPIGDVPEQANVVKIGANFMLGVAIESLAEATSLAEAHGIEAAEFIEVVTQTLFAAPAYQGYGALIKARAFEPAGFSLRLGHKDIGLALSAADQARVPLPLAAAVNARMLDGLANGDGDKDWSSLYEVAARQAHLDRRGS